MDTLRQAHLLVNGGKVNDDLLLFPSATKDDKPVELRKSWETAMRRAEIQDFRFHDLRHTAASYLAIGAQLAPRLPKCSVTRTCRWSNAMPT